MAKPNAAMEPGPGHYVDPIKEGRNANGEVHVVLSNQRGSKRHPSARAPREIREFFFLLFLLFLFLFLKAAPTTRVRGFSRERERENMNTGRRFFLLLTRASKRDSRLAKDDGVWSKVRRTAL